MKPKLICVQTSIYSGSTLLARLLAAHPEIATVGEMDGLGKNMKDIRTCFCSCGQRIEECEFWRSVKVSMHERGFEFAVDNFDTSFSLRDHPRVIRLLRFYSSGIRSLDSIRDTLFRLWPSEKNRLNRLIQRNEGLIESILEITKKRVFVDTAKDGLGRLQALRNSSKLKVCAVHLVRDVRGVVASRMRRGESTDAGWLAERWVRWNQNRQRALNTMRDSHHLLVRYEDLCQDPENSLQRLFRFFSVDPDFRITDYDSTPHHLLGNTMRLRPLSEIKLDERWKSQLSKDQIRTIEKVAARLGRQYRYF